MSKLIRISLGVDVDHNLIDFPINIYTGTTSGDTTNWGFTETPVLTFESVTTSPLEFYVEDELLSFGLRLEGQGCHLQDLFVESPRVDCEICGDFVEYLPPQPSATPNPTPPPTPNPTATPEGTPNPTATPGGTPNPTNSPTPSSTPGGTPNPTNSPTPSSTPDATPNPTNSPTPSPTVETQTYYRIESCVGGLSYHAPKDEYCNFGSISALTSSFNVGEVVQFIIASGGCGSATYCGTISNVNFSAVSGSETAYISRIVPVPDCEDTIHCAQ